MRQSLTMPSNKSCKTYFLVGKDKVYFNGNFDSGNLQKVQQISALTYRITPGFDMRTQTTRKNFFHFQTFGFKQCTVKFQVTRCYLLEALIKLNLTNNHYHPVVRTAPEDSFKKCEGKTQIYVNKWIKQYNSNDEPELSFTHDFDASSWAEFAFTYPYSYSDCQKMLKEVEDKYALHSSIYFHREVLTTTAHGRNVDLITITDIENCQDQREPSIPEILEKGIRPFKINKPKAIISSRVHPGQTPSSYCMEGIIRFLVNEKDFRSALLRKNFSFILIPMINPDGVYEGMFRTDLNGDNLNRFYKNCDKQSQNTIWSITQFLNSLGTVDFFFDLHAHPSQKGFFIYGNAFNQFSHQVEAQLFGKLVQFNCPYFENFESIFTQKAMKSKDKFDSLNKEGCARVFYHKKFQIIHSYTVECGYFWPAKVNKLQNYICPSVASKYCYTADWENVDGEEYGPSAYMLLGKSLLISLLDLFQLNPYSRLGLSPYQMIRCLRKATAQKIFSESQKFRLKQRMSFKKITNITSIIDQNYYRPRFEKYGLTVAELTVSQRNNIFNFHLHQPKMFEEPQSLQELPLLQACQNAENLTTLFQTSVPLASKGSQVEDTSQMHKSQCFERQNIDSSQVNIHHQLLCSFSKYKVQESYQKGNKGGTMKIRKIKTMEAQTAVLRKSLKAIHAKTQQDEFPSRQKIQTEVLQKLLNSKLEASSSSVIAVNTNNMSKYRWNNQSSRKVLPKARLPSLSTSKKEVLTSSPKRIRLRTE